MMSGQEQPDSGSITLGETVVLASVDQFRDSMNDKKTVFEEVADGQDILRIGNYEFPSRAYTPLQLQGRRSAEAGWRAVRW